MNAQVKPAARNWVVVLRDGRRKDVPETKELAANIADWGTKAVVIYSGVSQGVVSHVLDPEGNRLDA